MSGHEQVCCGRTVLPQVNHEMPLRALCGIVGGQEGFLAKTEAERGLDIQKGQKVTGKGKQQFVQRETKK